MRYTPSGTRTANISISQPAPFRSQHRPGVFNGLVGYVQYWPPGDQKRLCRGVKQAGPSPVAPKSDEEGASADAKRPAKDDKGKDDKANNKTPVAVHIDFENIDQRIVSLPIPERHYTGMFAGKEGVLYLLEAVDVVDQFRDQPSNIVHRFDLKTRRAERLVEHVTGFDVSAHGEKMLIKESGKWAIASAASAPKPGEGVLKTEAMEMRVDPRAEWRQMYNEVWRIERDFFYDPCTDGLNLKEAKEKYRPYLESVSSRDDLNYLFDEMLGELSVGHLFVQGGAMPEVKHLRGGLLGADYSLENGRYRFKTVYFGENWNPESESALD